MTDIRKIHEKAMEHAKKATTALAEGDRELFRRETEQAFLLEKEAARALTTEVDAEPTRGVLFRSAASLAFELKNFIEAADLVRVGLLGNPFPEIRDELTDLLNKIGEQPQNPEGNFNVQTTYDRIIDEFTTVNPPKKDKNRKDTNVSVAEGEISDLLREVKQNEPGALRRLFEFIYRENAQAIYNTVVRIVGNIEAAEDIVQEAFVSLYRQFEVNNFLPVENYKSKLKRIAINCAIDDQRKRKFDIQEKDLSIEEPTKYEMEINVQRIKELVKLLPTGYRTILVLYLFEGYDQEEIAEILGVSHAAVRTQYIRAKQKLLALIKKDKV